jgi:hypothetical protein
MMSKFVFIGLANAVNRIVGKTSAFAGVKTMLEAANHDFGDKLPLVRMAIDQPSTSTARSSRIPTDERAKTMLTPVIETFYSQSPRNMHV